MNSLSTRMFEVRARALVTQLRSHPELQTAMPDDTEFVWETFGRDLVHRFERVEGKYRAGSNGWPPSVFDIAAKGAEGRRLEEVRVTRLNTVFHMFVLPGEPEYFNGVVAELERLNPDYGVMNLPVPVSSEVAQVLLLPKDDPKTNRIAGLFLREGAVDFGEYLDQVVRRDVLALREGAAPEAERPRG